jgi:hypothetical protein
MKAEADLSETLQEVRPATEEHWPKYGLVPTDQYLSTIDGLIFSTKEIDHVLLHNKMREPKGFP